MKQRASDVMIEQLLAAGVDTVYGNPGTFEQQFLEALPRYPQLRYIMCLHESVAVGAGMGHAKVTKKPALVQLHASVGLGNGAGLILEAKQSRTPMVVYVGENAQRDEAYQGFLAADIVAIATPICKAVERVSVPEQLCRQLRRAFQIAMAPPMGPVVITIPMDVLEAMIEPDFAPLTLPAHAEGIAQEKAKQIADVLSNAKSPALVVGDGVGWEGAQDEIKTLSHLLGIPVYGYAWTLCNADAEDALFQHILSHANGSQNANLLEQHDALFFIGAPTAWEIFPRADGGIAHGAALIHLDHHAGDLGRNFPSLAVHAPIRSTLRQLIEVLAPHANAKRGDAWAAKKQAAWKTQEERWQAETRQAANHPAAMISALCRALPEDVLVYEEAMTSHPYVRHYFNGKKPNRYWRGLSRCLGADWPGAVALKLANPDAPLAAISADGNAMYVPQTLWTAAHHDLNIVFIVINNRSYRVLKHNLDAFRERAQIDTHDYPHMDLTHPAIDFAALAASMGVEAFRASVPAEVGSASAQAFRVKGPALVELVVDGSVSYA